MISIIVEKIRYARALHSEVLALKHHGSANRRVCNDFKKCFRQRGVTAQEYIDFDFLSQTKEFRDSFLGKNEQRHYLDLLNPKRYYILARNKYLTHLILEEAGIKAKSILYCYYNPEQSHSGNHRIGYNLESVLDSLLHQQVHQCVVKTTESSHGDNVYVVDDIEYQKQDAVFILFDGSKRCLSELLQRNPLIFESKIVQTSQMAAINASSVNTVRFMTTLFPDGEVKIIATFIKMGRAGKCVDNAGGGGNVDAGIDVESGRFFNTIQFDGWDKIQKITHHPDSMTKIEGEKIDNWDSIKEKVCEFAKAMPYVKAAGWDIAITDDGPVIIEVNDFWDTTGQLFVGNGWRDEIRKCYFSWKAVLDDKGMGRLTQVLTSKHITNIVNK